MNFLIADQCGVVIVSMLLAKQGVDVNQAADDGWTPLLFASQGGHAEVVSMLLAKQGVDVNQATNNGCTPLCMASCRGGFIAAPISRY